jgi:hypothetical protein
MEAAAAQIVYPYLTSSTYIAALEFAIALRQSLRRAPLPKDFNLETLAEPDIVDNLNTRTGENDSIFKSEPKKFILELLKLLAPATPLGRMRWIKDNLRFEEREHGIGQNQLLAALENYCRKFTLVMESFECSEEKAAELFVNSLHVKLHRDVKDSLGMKKEKKKDLKSAIECARLCASDMDNAADSGYIPTRLDPRARKQSQITRQVILTRPNTTTTAAPVPTTPVQIKQPPLSSYKAVEVYEQPHQYQCFVSQQYGHTAEQCP